MGHERWFRGQHDGQARPFDWLAAARQHGIPDQLARVLYEQALQQAHGATQGRAQELYLALLANARRDAARPSPGKVTRTMRLQAHRAGKRRRPHVSPVTGQPIAPGKRTLTWYLEPVEYERRARDRVPEVPVDAAAVSASIAQAAPSGAVRSPIQDAMGPGAVAHRQLQANLAAAFGYFEELDALDEVIHTEPATAVEASQPREGDEVDAAVSNLYEWPLAESQSPSAWQARASLGDAWKLRADDWPEISPEHSGSPWLTGTVTEESRQAAMIARQHVADDAGDPDHPMVHEALRRRGAGSPLPDDVRRAMEARLGVDLARVRVHTDAVAEQATLAVRARAFTVGEDIYFAAGALAPGTTAGADLLAHELTHVVQGREGRIPSASGVEVSRPDDALEREAEATSRGATRAAAPEMLADAAPSQGVVLHRTPEQAEELIERYTSWGNLDESALGRELLRLVTSGQITLADEVLTALGSTDRDDVAYAFMRAIGDPQLARLAAQPASRRFLDRIFDELTAGSVAEEEEQQANRLLQANQRATVSIGAFDGAATSRGTKIFPFRLPGFTVLNPAPIEARRERGKVWCRSTPFVLGTDRFREETKTLPTEYFLNGIVLPEDEVIGVRLYDQGGIIHYTTPLFLIQLSNATDQQMLEKILEAAGIALTLGSGALIGLGVRATLLARVLLWADRAAFVLGTITSVLREHRGWIVETFGSGFMDAVDTVHSASAIYGIARVALEAPRIILALRNGYRTFKTAAQARSSQLSSSERTTVQSVTQSTDELLQQVDQIQSARTDASQGGQPRAGEPAIGDTPEVGASPQAGAQPNTPGSPTGPSRQPPEGEQGGGGGGASPARPRPPLRNADGTPYSGPTANPNELRVSQDWVSPETSDGISIPDLAERMRSGGWRGDPIDVVEMPDGGLLSVDNRRIVAARMAELPEVPVRIRPFTEPFPPAGMPAARARSFNLRNAIRQAPDGRMYTGDGPDPIVYPAGTVPTNWGEASLFRTANQGQSIEPGRFPGGNQFPVGGTTRTPIIRGRNPPSRRGGGGQGSGGGGGESGPAAPPR